MKATPQVRATLFVITGLFVVASPYRVRAELDWCRYNTLTPGDQKSSVQAVTGASQLVVYYVLPSDIPFEDVVNQRLVDASLDIQAWYQCASGGVTWEFASPEIVQVYHAQRNRQYYADQDWWGPLLGEMAANGAPIWEPGTVVAIWARGAGGWAGGAQACGNQCGVALLGIELFPEFNNPDYSEHTCPGGVGAGAWPCTPVGAFAHELGHTLGLPHPADAPLTAANASHSVMQTHWNYPDWAPPNESPWGLLSLERQSIRANPFMKVGISLAQRYPNCDIVNLPPNGPTPSAQFSVNQDCEEIQTSNSSTGASLYYWTFGDGEASNAASPNHTYPGSGEYELRLRASGDNAMMAEQVTTVSVNAESSPRPQLLSPPNGATAVPVTGVLDWGDALNAVRYSLRVWCPSGETIVSASSLFESRYDYTLPDADYQWFVSAYNECGQTLGPSDIWNFSVGVGSTCSIPVLKEPADSSQCVGIASSDPRTALAILRWEPTSEASEYLLRIRRGAGQGSCDNANEIQVTGTEYLAEVDWGETYSWSVKEDCPCAVYSECRLFTTASRPVRAPSLLSPGLHENGVPLSGVLEWSAVAQAVGYRVLLGMACGDVDSVDVVGTTWAYSDLEQNTQYFWRVRSLDACGNGDYSTCWDFQTAQFTGIDRVYFPGGLIASPGETGFELPILIENQLPLQRIEKIDLRFSGTVFEVAGWTLDGTRSAAVPGVTVDFTAVGPDQARFKITYSSDSSCPQSLGTGVGAVLKLLLNIKPNAPLGMAALTLNDAEFRKCGGGTVHPSEFDGQVNIVISTDIGNLPPIVGLTVLAHYPNPFGSSATIDVGLPNVSNVELQVFDVTGRRVSSQSMGEMGQGWQRITMQATDDSGELLPSGVYFYRVMAAGKAITRKMVIAR